MAYDILAQQEEVLVRVAGQSATFLARRPTPKEVLEYQKDQSRAWKDGEYQPHKLAKVQLKWGLKITESLKPGSLKAGDKDLAELEDWKKKLAQHDPRWLQAVARAVFDSGISSLREDDPDPLDDQ